MARWVATRPRSRPLLRHRAETSGDRFRAHPQVSRGSHLPLRAGIGANRRCAGWTARRTGKACRSAPGTPQDGRRPHARSSAARADPDPVKVPAPPAHQMASHPMRFLPLGPDSALAALAWFPLFATRSHPLKRRAIRLGPLRDRRAHRRTALSSWIDGRYAEAQSKHSRDTEAIPAGRTAA